MRGQRFKTRREAEDSYTHYLDQGGTDVRTYRELPRERVPRGYYVDRAGYPRKHVTTHAQRRAYMTEIGRSTQFRKDEYG